MKKSTWFMVEPPQYHDYLSDINSYDACNYNDLD